MAKTTAALKLVPPTTPSDQWRKWADPRADNDDWTKDRDAHRLAILNKAKEAMEETMGFRSGQRAPVALLAAISGLSESTVRTYVRKSKFGKRGPLLTTYLSLKLLDRV
jgi:hypothetical protein